MTQDMVSFVLRFVREAGEEQEARWRGIIKHVQSNNETHFSQFAEALEFMQVHINEVVKTAVAETAAFNNANPFLETTRLWGDYMPHYTRLMLETVKETMTAPFATTPFATTPFAATPFAATPFAATPFAGPPMAQQMENALLKTWAAWGLPTPVEQEQTAGQLESLLAQLVALQTKVQELEAQISQEKAKQTTDDLSAAMNNEQ